MVLLRIITMRNVPVALITVINGTGHSYDQKNDQSAHIVAYSMQVNHSVLIIPIVTVCKVCSQ